MKQAIAKTLNVVTTWCVAIIFLSATLLLASIVGVRGERSRLWLLGLGAFASCAWHVGYLPGVLLAAIWLILVPLVCRGTLAVVSENFSRAGEVAKKAEENEGKLRRADVKNILLELIKPASASASVSADAVQGNGHS